MSLIESGGLSQTGPVREDNQDALRLPEAPGSLFGVADGMGGYANGGLASRLALETLERIFVARGTQPVRTALRQGVERANLAVYRAAQELAAGRMGTTLTAACIEGGTLHLAHVGDSRAYLVRAGRAVCLTTDHTRVGELVRARIIAPERVRTHAQRSLLTRALGLDMFVQPELRQVPLQDGDRLVLCSDGVWAAVEDGDFARLAQDAASALGLSQTLVELALERGSDDNVSALAIFVQRLAAPASAGGWLAALRRRLQPGPEKTTERA